MAKEINAGLQIVYRKLSEMHPNPKNPRKQGDDGIVPLAESIEANPQFFEARPILLSDRTGKLVIIGGERRWEAAQYLEMENAPSILFSELTEEQEDEIMVRDNTHAGVWDAEKLQQWDAAELRDWGLLKADKWDGGELKSGIGDSEYEAFKGKFQPKLTTDNCYTPAEVYDTVRDYVNEEILPLEDRLIKRPFYPGGDYEHDTYPEGCVVIDNPPFSLMTKIVRFYSSHQIPFFLFAQSMTCFVAPEIDGLTYIITNSLVEFENGAKINISFVTNLIPDVRIRISHTLAERIANAQKKIATVEKYKFPSDVVTAARLGKFADSFDMDIRADDIKGIVRELTDKRTGRRVGVYGGGYVISKEKSIEIKELERELELELSGLKPIIENTQN